MGFEMTETPRATINDLSDQNTAYFSPASTFNKPGFTSFVKKAPRLGDGLVVGAELKFDPSKATPDRAQSSSRRPTDSDIFQRSKTVRQVGQNLAESKQTIIAVKENLDENEGIDLSSFEGSQLSHRMSNQTLDPSSSRSQESSQNTALSYFFPEDPDIPNWRPFSMSTWYISLLIGLSLGLAVFQEWLCQHSLGLAKGTPPHGILEFNEVTEVSLWNFFAWKYLPTMITIFYAVLVSIMDFDIRRLEPYHQLSRPLGSRASHSLNLDHLTVFQYFVPLRAAQLKQWAVFFSTLANIVASTVAPSLQNPSVSFVPNPICESGTCEGKDHPKLYFVRIQSVWSRALEASLVLTAILLTVILVILLRRKSGLQSDPKGIAGIAAMATKSHILNDFQDMDLATRGQIHKRLNHRKFILYKSSIWQGQYDRDTEPPPRGDLKSPHPFMLQLRFGIPFIAVLFFVLGSIPVISFTPARIIPNDAPWLPISLATILKMIWTTLESDVRLIEPFYRLSKGKAKPQESLTLDYQGTVYGWMPIRALINGHFLLVLVGISSVALDVLTVTISSFSVNSQVFLLRNKPGIDESNQDETRVSFFTSVVLSMTITVFVIFTASLVYLRRRHPFLPREPSTIAAILAFIYASKMLDDFVGTEHLTNRQMENKLKGLDKRYSLGWFRGRDGKMHCAIDEEPMRSRYVHGVSYREAQAPWEDDEGVV